jgi:hypothetical protein
LRRCKYSPQSKYARNNLSSQALLSSKISPEAHLQTILTCTRGIIFLGTPHFGAGLATIIERLAQLIRPTSQTNLKTVEVLRRDSDILARTQNDFHSLLRSRTIEGFRPIQITCFYEELPLPGIGEVKKTLPSYFSISSSAERRNHQLKLPGRSKIFSNPPRIHRNWNSQRPQGNGSVRYRR